MNDDILKKLSHLRYWTESTRLKSRDTSLTHRIDRLRGVSAKSHRYKHQSRTNPNHDQREHGNWAEGMGGTRDGVVPTGGGGAGGIQGLAQQLSAASRKRKPVQVSSGQMNFLDTLDAVNPIKQLIAAFKSARDKERLPRGFDVDTFKSKMSYAGGGASKVQKFVMNGKTYFYRGTPLYWGRGGGNIPMPTYAGSMWSVMRGPLKGIAADNIASGMGLPLAPVAQETKNGLTVSNSLDIDPDSSMNIFVDLQNAFVNDPTPENFEKLRSFVEPLAVMDLIIGQNDGHSGNVNVIKNSNRGLYDSEYILTSVDYDLSGHNKAKSMAADLFFETMLLGRKYFPNNTEIFSDRMKQILRDFSDNVEWHPSVPDIARKQYLTRAQELIDISENSARLDSAVSANWGLTSFNPVLRQRGRSYTSDIGVYFTQEISALLTPSARDLTTFEVKEKALDAEQSVQNMNEDVAEYVEDIRKYETTEVGQKVNKSLAIDIDDIDRKRVEIANEMQELLRQFLDSPSVDEQKEIESKIDKARNDANTFLEMAMAYKQALNIASLLGTNQNSIPDVNESQFDAEFKKVYDIANDANYDTDMIADKKFYRNTADDVREFLKTAIGYSLNNGTFAQLAGILNQYAINPDPGQLLANPINTLPIPSASGSTPVAAQNMNPNFFSFFSGKGLPTTVRTYQLPVNVVNYSAQLQNFLNDVQNVIKSNK